MNKKNLDNDFGFPSDLLDPEVKKGKKYCLAYSRAVDERDNQGSGTHLLRTKSVDYRIWRDYARGDQEITQYETILNGRKNRGKQNISFKALDLTILPIIPKFVNILVGRLIGQNNRV
ncbi:MAG TPA: hypothetical protein ENH60_03580, partial [Pricia sp.]|nr:hypothetical protein [Pricia sp.]